MVKQRKYIFRLIGILFFLFCYSGLAAQSPIPGINISVNPADNPEQVATTLQIVFLLTVLTLAPALLIMTTSFTRFVIVLSFLRQGYRYPANSFESDHHRDFVVSDFICHDACLRGSQ